MMPATQSPSHARRAGRIRRVVEPETLDVLDAGDPLAVHARGDLRRMHRAMGTRAILVKALVAMFPRPLRRPLHVLELGAGDGTLMLGVARALARSGWAAELTLLDRRPCVEATTLDGFTRLGWDAAPVLADVDEWIVVDNARPHPPGPRPLRWDLIVANLFLHHFEGHRLVALLEAVAARTEVFVACEPRRATLALAASLCVGAIGANAVSRHDAVASVRAGFAGNELAALWPGTRRAWNVLEYDAGLFSHCFRARRAPADANVL